MTTVESPARLEDEVQSLIHLRTFLEELMYASRTDGQKVKSPIQMCLQVGFSHVARQAARFVEFKQADQQTVPWSAIGETGTELKGAAHYRLLADRDRVSYMRYELLLDSMFEELAVGCLVVSWSYWLNGMSGFGVVPYFRKEVLGHFKSAEGGTFRPDFCQTLSGKLANAKTTTEEQHRRLNAATQALSKIQPLLCGWNDEVNGLFVWSVRQLAQNTIEKSMGELIVKYPFWSRRRECQLRVTC